jgi:hypothetical protein
MRFAKYGDIIKINRKPLASVCCKSRFQIKQSSHDLSKEKGIIGMKLVKLYLDCIRRQKGMNDFNAYMETRAIFGCSVVEAWIIDRMYKDLVAKGTPTLVMNGYASPF